MLFLNIPPQRLDTGATPTFAGALFGDGTAAVPSISFSAQSSTGFYRIAGDQIGVALGGTAYHRFAHSGADAYFTGIGSRADTFLMLGANGNVGIGAGGTNQNITLTPSGTGVVLLSGPLQLSNAYAAGVVAPTGTIVIKDSTGTSYRVACAV